MNYLARLSLGKVYFSLSLQPSLPAAVPSSTLVHQWGFPLSRSQTATLLRFHEWSFPALSRRHNLLADFLVFWFLRSSHSPTLPWVWELCCRCIRWDMEPHCSLHSDQLGCSVMVSAVKKKLLWWRARALLTHEHKDELFRLQLGTILA